MFKKKSHHKIITQENSLFIYIIIWSIFTLLNFHKHLHSLKFQIVFFNVMSIHFSNSCTVYIIFEFVFINMWILYGIYKSWIHIKIHMHNWCKRKILNTATFDMSYNSLLNKKWWNEILKFPIKSGHACMFSILKILLLIS